MNGTAVPDDGQLLHQALAEGGLSIETRAASGEIQFRTVVQLDGDVMHWVRRAQTAASDTDDPVADAHLAAVTAHVAALEAALGKLEGSARRWIARARFAARGVTLTSAATAAIGKLGGYPALALASGAVGVVSLAAARWIAPRVGRRLLRLVAAWVGGKIVSG